jgi:hypothetical protein
MGDSGALDLDGTLALSLSAMPRGLAMVGVAPRPGLDGPVEGTIRLLRKAGALELTTQKIAIADTIASGTIRIETVKSGNRITGDITLDRAGLAGFLEALTVPGASSPRIATSKSPWSEAALDLSGLAQFDGSRIRVTVARLAIAPGAELESAPIEITARPEGLDIRLDEATALGGKASGVLSLTKAAAGVNLMVEAMATGLKLDRLPAGPNGSAMASGGVAATVKMQGTALSPRGLVVALSGNGQLALSQARLNRWTPAGVGMAADAVITLKGEIPPGALRQQLELALQSGGVNLGSPRLALTVADGAIRATPIVAGSPGSRLTAKAAIDLDQMLIEGDMKIESRLPAPASGAVIKQELPAIAVTFSGPLAAWATLDARIDIDALEREVAVRKVEREVAELERLRRLDEERARAEQLRIEAERQARDRPRPEQPGADLSIQNLPVNGSGTSTSTGQPDAAPLSGAGQGAAAQIVPPTGQPAASTAVPAQKAAPSPAKAPRRDPFGSIREYSP